MSNSPLDNVEQLNGYTVVHPHEHVFHLKNVFSAKECDELVQWNESIGFDLKLDYDSVRSQFRNNDRLSDMHMPLVAEKLTQACKPIVVQKDETGRTPTSVLERMRFSKYTPGQHFAAHFDDGFFVNDGARKGQWSIYAVIIYLNDDYVGGSTKFLKCKAIPEDFEIFGSKGDVLIFQQKGILHQGSPVEEGTKYILASSMMYSPFPKEYTGTLPAPAIFKYSKEIRKILAEDQKKNLKKYDQSKFLETFELIEKFKQKKERINNETRKNGRRTIYSLEAFSQE